MEEVWKYFGNIDIYLFDQIQKGRFNPGMKILDAGCGSGRNLIYFMREGYTVYGVDNIPFAIDEIKRLISKNHFDVPESNFTLENVEQMSFADETFDVVISSAVLHFAENESHFYAMMDEMWRVLKKGGVLFARLGSDNGIEKYVKSLGDGKFILPEGAKWFLVNEMMIYELANRLNAKFLEPLKTTNVENKRCMATLVWAKN